MMPSKRLPASFLAALPLSRYLAAPINPANGNLT
jgi:hypothetical protein